MAGEIAADSTAKSQTSPQTTTTTHAGEVYRYAGSGACLTDRAICTVHSAGKTHAAVADTDAA